MTDRPRGRVRSVADPHGKTIGPLNLKFCWTFSKQPDGFFFILTGYPNVVAQAGFAVRPGRAGWAFVYFSNYSANTKGIRRQDANFVNLQARRFRLRSKG